MAYVRASVMPYVYCGLFGIVILLGAANYQQKLRYLQPQITVEQRYVVRLEPGNWTNTAITIAKDNVTVEGDGAVIYLDDWFTNTAAICVDGSGGSVSDVKVSGFTIWNVSTNWSPYGVAAMGSLRNVHVSNMSWASHQGFMTVGRDPAEVQKQSAALTLVKRWWDHPWVSAVRTGITPVVPLIVLGGFTALGFWMGYQERKARSLKPRPDPAPE